MRAFAYSPTAKAAAPVALPSVTRCSVWRRAAHALAGIALVLGLGVVGLIATSSTPEEMARSQQAEYDRWGPLVKQIGFSGDS